MGYFLKNRRLDSAGSAVVVPAGSTALRPTNPINGTIRYNSDTSRFEIYYNAWQTVAINGNVSVTKDTFVGDGSSTSFTLSKTPVNEQSLIVFIGNIHQNPSVAYTVSSSNINFSSTPPEGQTIVVFQGFNSTDAN